MQSIYKVAKITVIVFFKEFSSTETRRSLLEYIDTVSLEMRVVHWNPSSKASFSTSEKLRPNSILLEKSPYLPQRWVEECAKIAAVDVLLTRKMQLHNSIFLVLLLQCCVGNKTIPIELKAISRAVKMPLDLVSFVQRQKSFLTAKVCNLI